MIQLIDDYYIDGTERDFVLKKKMNWKTKTGEQSYKVCGYYGSVLNAVSALYKQLQMEIIKKNELTFREAIEQFEAVEKRLKVAMSDCLK